ncbi:MAG: helix-turn-helix domain-containing protein [Rubrivivax sp.]|nr:helix-turn-helix domain-containing protein [Rubrivivax sp.]
MAVTAEPIHDDLTIQDTADLLKISRLQVIKLIETGALHVHRTGEHKRVRLADQMRFKAVQDRASSEAMAELARQGQERACPEFCVRGIA